MLAHSAAERDQLLKQHFGLVHHVARKMQKHLSTEASFDDLVSAGSVGLMSAAENFDPARGLAFSTFALPRIRGAILDDLRKQDRVPRSVRRRARALPAARTAGPRAVLLRRADPAADRAGPRGHRVARVADPRACRGAVARSAPSTALRDGELSRRLM